MSHNKDLDAMEAEARLAFKGSKSTLDNAESNLDTSNNSTHEIDLPPELNCDKDLIDAASHHRNLQDLHDLIYENSVTAIFRNGGQIVRHPSYDRLPQKLSSSKLQEISTALSDENDLSVQTLAYRYIECYSIIERIRRNISILQRQGFCNDEVNFLAITPQRTYVTGLRYIRVSEIEELCLEIESHLKESFGLSEDPSLVDSFNLSDRVLDRLSAPFEHQVTSTRSSLYGSSDLSTVALGASVSTEHLKTRQNREFSKQEYHQKGASIDNKTDGTAMAPDRSDLSTWLSQSADLMQPSYKVGHYRTTVDSSIPPTTKSVIQQLHRTLERSVYNLNSWVFTYYPQKFNDNGLNTYEMLQSIDLIVISYGGAHLLNPMLPGEQVNWSYLNLNGRKMTYDNKARIENSYVIFTRRKLRCLDGFFGGRKLWILHCPRIEPDEFQNLYLYAHPKQFNDIWGPIWKVSPSRNTKEILRYDLENGSIVPSETSTEGFKPRLYGLEILCHWISHHDLVTRCTSSALHEPLLLYKEEIPLGYGLLIGAAGLIHCICNNDTRCGCDSSRLMSCLKDRNYLHYPGVHRAQWVKDTRQVVINASIGKAPFTLNAGRTDTRKYIAPESLREATLKRWTLEPDKRNPQIMLHYRGIEISQCAYHSRRVQLINLLGTETMRQWWRIFKAEIADSEHERNRISEALERNPSNLIQYYIDGNSENNSGMRKSIGKLFGRFFDVLHDTGAASEVFSAFWFQKEELYAKFPLQEFGWSKISGASYVVLEQKCLVFKKDQDMYHPKGGPLPSQKDDPSLFESSLVINDTKEGTTKKSGLRLDQSAWSVEEIKKGTSLGIMPRGSFKIVIPLSRRHLLVEWDNETTKLRERERFHREFINDASTILRLPTSILSRKFKWDHTINPNDAVGIYEVTTYDGSNLGGDDPE